MPHPCPHHCPSSSSVLGAVLAAVAVAVIGWAVAQVVASVAAAVMAAGFAVLGAAAVAGAAVVRHMNRPVPLARGAESVQERRAVRGIPSPAAIPRRQPLALSARRVVPGTVITDARQRARVTRDGS